MRERRIDGGFAKMTGRQYGTQGSLTMSAIIVCFFLPTMVLPLNLITNLIRIFLFLRIFHSPSCMRLLRFQTTMAF